MTYDLASNLDAAVESYFENADYHATGSSAKATAFITACRRMLPFLPKLVSHGPNQLSLSPDQVQRELTAARSWLAANGDTATGTAGVSGAVRYASFEHAR